MKRSGDGSYHQRLEARERHRLPVDLRDRWDSALRSKVLRLPPFKHPKGRITAKCLSRQSPATRATLLTRLNRLLRLAAEAGLPSGLEGLLHPLHLQIVFETTGVKFRGKTRWGLCSALWRMAWELRGEDAGWVLVGGRRFRKKDDGRVRPVDPELPDRVRARAREMHAEVPPVATLTVLEAIKLRTAAHAMLHAELGARRSEIALPKLRQLFFTRAGLVIVLDGDHSKMDINGRETISDETAALLVDYKDRGRPVLLRSALDGPSRGLWLTANGLDAEAETMAATFARAMNYLRPEGVCCTDLRRAVQSQEGQSAAEMARYARNAPGSNTGPIVYAGRDRAKAVAKGQAMSSLEARDVPSFVSPAPGKRTRGRTANRS